MKHHNQHEEYLERLWRMKEEKEDSCRALREAIGDDFDDSVVEELSSEDLVELTEDSSRINLTQKGEVCSRRIIRAHRLAEKLVCDVLGGEFESSACEFEHIVNTELINSICTLLGHPRQCPHGLEIPEGECCKRFAKTIESSVIPLTELEPGISARVAYVNCSDNQRLHRIDSLQIKQGSVITIQQKSPAYVISCEGADIALDSDVASSIQMWKECRRFDQAGGNADGPQRGCRKGKRFGFLRRKRAQT